MILALKIVGSPFSPWQRVDEGGIEPYCYSVRSSSFMSLKGSQFYSRNGSLLGLKFKAR
jgi:hypothetical protein